MKKSFLFLFIMFIFTPLFPQIPPTKKESDPFKDLENAKSIAAKENKKILIVVGGNWCNWCQRFDDFINKDKELVEIVNKHFVVVKIYCNSDLTPNGLFLAKFPIPSEFPYIYILNSDGILIESKRTATLEEGETYSKVKVKDFLLNYAQKK